MMIAPELSSLVTEGNIFDPSGLLDIGQAVFSVILFAVSLYAWYLRKQISLVIVALAFLMFFVRTVIREFFAQIPGEDFITDFLDFVALTLFFLAVVVSPRKDLGKGTSGL